MATYSSRPAVARVFIGQPSCSADVVFILGMVYLYLRVLRLRTRHQSCGFYQPERGGMIEQFHDFCVRHEVVVLGGLFVKQGPLVVGQPRQRQVPTLEFGSVKHERLLEKQESADSA